ncbi:hypothetical protein E4U36_005872, partial [Claviceps purpurea]
DGDNSHTQDHDGPCPYRNTIAPHSAVIATAIRPRRSTVIVTVTRPPTSTVIVTASPQQDPGNCARRPHRH